MCREMLSDGTKSDDEFGKTQEFDSIHDGVLKPPFRENGHVC